MKVAIMGAGLSGLACAMELERHGIEPIIFEKRRTVGDRFVNGEVFFSLFSRPVLDEIRYLSERHKLYLQPITNINQLIVSAPEATATLKGRVGFITSRGRHAQSLEGQLARTVKTDIRFHSEESYEHVAQHYTHVVLATGDATYTEKLQRFDTSSTVTLAGATVEGQFQPHQVQCWLDNSLAPHGGYGYVIPLSRREASLVVAYPEKHGFAAYDSQRQWDLFFRRAQKDLGQELKVTDTFEVNRYIMGLAQHPRIGNTFFVGNCFGALMPFMGFGQFQAILTGIYAAWDICGLGDYECLTEPLRHAHQNSLALRRAIEQMDNSRLNQVVDKLNGFWGRKLVETKVDVLKWGSYLARISSLGLRNS